MSMKFRFAVATALSCAVTILPGCGNSGTEVAQTPKETIVSAPVTDSSGEEDEGEGEASYGGEEDYGGEDYGGEGYGEENAMASRGNGGGGRGGRSGGRPSLGAGVDAGYGEEEMMASGGGGEYGDEGGYSMPGYSMGGGESEYGGEGQGMSGYSMGGGYAGEGDGEMVGAGGPGMGGGFGGGFGGGLAGGMGGGGSAGSMVQFVSQNCFQCHGRGQAKGGVRLDSLDADFGDKANAELWTSVIDAVESGDMPPANSRRLDPQQKNRFLDMVRKAMDEAGVGVVDYLADAKKAFGKGREKAAIEYLYAHIVTTDDEQADALLRQSRWFAYGKRPTTTLRFATGVILDAPTTLTDVKPIGSSQMGGGGFGGEGMGMGRGGRGGRGGAAGNGQRDFVSLTGDLGRSMVGAFESRWTAGNLGTIFSEVVYSDPAESRAGGSFGSNRGFGGMGMGGMGMGGPGYGDGEGQGGYGGGMYGGRGYGGEGGRPGGGGEAGYGGEGYGGEGNIETTAMADLRENIMPGQTVTPGLIYLGEASQADLIARANARGVDAVFIFDVDATRNRMGVVNNETRIRLVPVEGKPIGATKVLKNTEVERARLRGTGDDDVQKNIDRLFKSFDDNLVLTSMPRLKPEHAQNRIRQLLAQREALPEDEEAEMDMTVLYETRLFNSMGIITNEEMSTVYQIVLRGNEGETLATGSVEDKQMVIEGFLTSL